MNSYERVMTALARGTPDRVPVTEFLIDPTVQRAICPGSRYGSRVCLVGNIDCGALLSHGTTGQVEAAVRQAITDAGAGGGYMLSSSNSIHSSVNPENFAAMVDAAHRWGGYEPRPAIGDSGGQGRNGCNWAS